jgi:predicted NAD/FAD-binding protein
VDTGFIVFNHRTYPNFTRLLERLGVASRETEMSFSVRCERTGLEYNGTSIDTLFAQRRNLLRPAFWGMLRDIMRFNREATALLEAPDDSITMGELLRDGGYGREFIDHYIVPMGGAVWSAPTDAMLAFPASMFIRFFHNHGFLKVNDRPVWRTVCGGSREYVRKLVEPLADRLRLRSPVTRVRRTETAVEIDSLGRRERFDAVVMACHSDQSLRMLADPTDAEQQILGAIPYQANEAVLHTDESLMPRTPKAWAAWNAHLTRSPADRVAVTYDMNILQGLDSREHFLVTLNRGDDIDPSRVLRRINYHHPVFTTDGLAAQRRHDEISGCEQRTFYAGAYWRYGFHEDGVVSALRVAEQVGVAGLVE